MNYQMRALRDMLDERGIKWWDNSDEWFERTFIWSDNTTYSIIFNEKWSYGGEEGLLESMPPVHPDYDEDEVEGYLTAEDIIKALRSTEHVFYTCYGSSFDSFEEAKEAVIENLWDTYPHDVEGAIEWYETEYSRIKGWTVNDGKRGKLFIEDVIYWGDVDDPVIFLEL